MTDQLLEVVQDAVARDPAALTQEIRHILIELRRIRIFEVAHIESILGMERRKFRSEIGDNDAEHQT